MSFVFADSPSGDGKDERSDAFEPRSFLLQKAKRKKPIGPNAGAADTSRLLEVAASEANLARALLNVVRNKGAPEVDGYTVEAAEAKAPADRPSAPRLAGGKLPARRSPPRLAAKARPRTKRARHPERRG